MVETLQKPKYIRSEKPSINNNLKKIIKIAIDLAFGKGEDGKGMWSVYREADIQIWYEFKLDRLAIRYNRQVVLVYDKGFLVKYLPGEWEVLISVYE